MSYKIKSSLYFASFVIAAFTYYNVGQTGTKEVAMDKEVNSIENRTVATPNGAGLNNLQ